MKRNSACEMPDDDQESCNVVIHYNSKENPATRAFVDQLDKALSVTHNMFVAPANPITIRTTFSATSADTGTVQS